VRNRAAPFLLTLAMVLSFITSVIAKDQSSTSSEISSACNSFGVVKSQVERKAPSFSLKTLNGDEVALDGLKGKHILLKFWATWCPSCLEELPMMQKFSEGRRDQLVILLAAIDGEKDKRSGASFKRIKLPYPFC